MRESSFSDSGLQEKPLSLSLITGPWKGRP